MLPPLTAPNLLKVPFSFCTAMAGGIANYAVGHGLVSGRLHGHAGTGMMPRLSYR